MTKSILESWPENYLTLRSEPPEGFKFSERVVAPHIQIHRNSTGFTAVLCGQTRIRGHTTTFPAVSLGHNWVLDAELVRPLPRDIAVSIITAFSPVDLAQMSFAEVIAVVQRTQDIVSIGLADDVFVSASESAAGFSDAIEIPGLQAKLFPYQAGGVAWMHETLSHTGGLILADEMGLGKTIQIISLLLLTPPDKKAPALIICPTSLIANWRREIFRFAPELSVFIHRGADRTGYFRDLQVAQVIITTYETAVSDISIFTAVEWSWVICDEAQAIKNPQSARRRALATVPRARSILMTGTPVENSLLDLWSLVDFAIPSLLGTQNEFETKYPDSSASAHTLNTLIDPILLRRRVEDVASDLPDRIDVDLPVDLGEELAHDYERVRVETIEKYPQAGALVATGQLQLFCAHPWLQLYRSKDIFWDDASIKRGAESSLLTPKLERTIALIRAAFASGRKVLVFSAFNRCGDLIREALDIADDVFWGVINGSTEQEERQNIVDQFSEFEGKACMVLNPKAAGTGLNITSATVVIHYTQVWNPALEAQASARAHRRGQTAPVTIYRLYYEDTVESVMIERARWKREIGNEAVPISTRDVGDLKRALEITPENRHV